MLNFRQNYVWNCSLLLAIFLGPYLFACWMYAQHFELPTVNHGVLLQPSRSFKVAVPIKMLPHHWHLVYVTDQCGILCLQDMAIIRQVRIALSTHADRLHRALFLSKKDQSFKLNHVQQPDLSLHYLTQSMFSRLLKNRTKDRGLYMLDPHGQAILFYGTQLTPKPVYEDLRRLLKYG